MLKGECVEDDYVTWGGREKQINCLVEIASLTKIFLGKLCLRTSEKNLGFFF